MTVFIPNLKICGITTPETARFCAEAGAGALGVIFFAKSPRYVTPDRARQLFEDVPDRVARVGVFVDLPPEEMIGIARAAKLDTVQMHGSEPLEAVQAALEAGFTVVKVLKCTGKNLMASARALPQEVEILVECGRGTLPGGNGAVWNWADAAPLADLRPFAVAGGLTPQNLAEAARLSRATAWDVSSGVERAPGVKDHAAVLELVKNAQPLGQASHTHFWKGIHE